MGIFNSKNLKKAVNMVASSSPVINAISQATDIVDKSMDVIDKNLNGGKNWNFSEPPKDEVAKAFMNGVRGKHIVCMMTNISDTAKASIRDNFNLDIHEQILFFNDTSFFGNKNQGIVITTKKLAWIPDNDEETYILLHLMTLRELNIARCKSIYGDMEMTRIMYICHWTISLVLMERLLPLKLMLKK